MPNGITRTTAPQRQERSAFSSAAGSSNHVSNSTSNTCGSAPAITAADKVAGKLNAGRSTGPSTSEAINAAVIPLVQLFAEIIASPARQNVSVSAASNSQTSGPKFENQPAL